VLLWPAGDARGAIDMARAELHFGGNERLRRMAQEMPGAAAG
jgi:hypothetical protein